MGRYAESDDPDKTRCVDLIDLNTGIVAGKLCDPIASQIMVVCYVIIAVIFLSCVLLGKQVQQTW